METGFVAYTSFSELLPLMVKLVIAAALGGIVGYEREVHERPAGLRTHILVSMGAALMTMVSIQFGIGGNDPARIAAQIVSGIGFLGAGTILRQGSIVRGLTTAASLWTVAGIGMAVAVGGVNIILAVFATVIVFVTLSFMRRFEPVLGKKTDYSLCLVIPENAPTVLGSILQVLSSRRIAVELLAGNTILQGRCTYRLRVSLPTSVSPEELASLLSEHQGLESFELS